jgi:uncharacterized protein (TIGR02996 family)
LNDDEAFVRAILAAPGDKTLRLVYADWLEERGDHVSTLRAEYLRAECELDALPSEDLKRPRLRRRLLDLRKSVGNDWWRELDFAKVERCVRFEYRCPQRWDTLSPSDDPAVRICHECQERFTTATVLAKRSAVPTQVNVLPSTRALCGCHSNYCVDVRAGSSAR